MIQVFGSAYLVGVAALRSRKALADPKIEVRGTELVDKEHGRHISR